MQAILKQGVPKMEQESLEHTLPNLNWENIRVFIAVTRAESFRAAEKSLNMSLNTIRRRIERLEQELGYLLFTRHVSGLLLTSHGQRLYTATRRMEEASFDVLRTASSRLSELSGPVRISVTEGIGTFWLVPRLVEFQKAFPLITADLRCAMDRADVARMEADISIQLERPENPDLKVVKLGRLHLMPFAAQSYLQTYGYPTSVEDGRNHTIVEQVSDQIDSSILSKLYPEKSAAGFISFRINSSSAHYWAVAKGAGIGVLPTYLWLLGAKIIPLDVGFDMHRDIWLAYHPDVRKIRPISVTIDWLKRAFDSERFPWFGDEFIPPAELEKLINDDVLKNMFDGFSGR